MEKPLISVSGFFYGILRIAFTLIASQQRIRMFAELTSAVQSVQALTTLLNSANNPSNYNEIVAAPRAIGVDGLNGRQL
jgi:hypothetical protein